MEEPEKRFFKELANLIIADTNLVPEFKSLFEECAKSNEKQPYDAAYFGIISFVLEFNKRLTYFAGRGRDKSKNGISSASEAISDMYNSIKLDRKGEKYVGLATYMPPMIAWMMAEHRTVAEAFI